MEKLEVKLQLKLKVFNQYRPLLFAIAYRMLGSITDAEDMIQEAWIRWQSTPTKVQSPKAFLSTLITRLCIDCLRSARVQREKYVGVWLPEPLMTKEVNYYQDNYQDNAELAESLSFAFLTLLECLSPIERAIFLLKEVFDYNYVDISQVVGKSITNCRQILCRARQRLLIYRQNNSINLQHNEETVIQLLASWHQGDLQKLISLMAEDVTFFSDGGGRTIAAQKPLHGNQKVAGFLVAIQRSRLIPKFTSQIVPVNGRASILNEVAGRVQSIFSFDFVECKIKSIFAVVNPDKLKHIKYHTLNE